MDTGSTNRAIVKRMIGLGVGAALFSGLFVLSYGYAIHSPYPHSVRISIVAPAPVRRAAQAALDHAQPGGFDLAPVRGPAQARRDVMNTSSFGALVIPAAGPVEVFTASAAGSVLQQTIIKALSGVAQRQGRAVRPVDLVPLPVGDRAGQSSFAFELALLVPSVIGSVAFYLLGRRARLWVRVAGAVGYAVLAAALGVLVLDATYGALVGSPGTLMATAALAAGAFVLTLAALHALFGLAGTAVAAGALLVVGNAVNGGSVAIPLLPDGYRQIAPWLPNAASIQAFRDDVYFHGHGMAQPLLALTIWVVAAVAVIAAADVIHVRQRRLAPDRHEQIHATSVLAHLRRGQATG